MIHMIKSVIVCWICLVQIEPTACSLYLRAARDTAEPDSQTHHQGSGIAAMLAVFEVSAVPFSVEQSTTVTYVHVYTQS